MGTGKGVPSGGMGWVVGDGLGVGFDFAITGIAIRLNSKAGAAIATIMKRWGILIYAKFNSCGNL